MKELKKHVGITNLIHLLINLGRNDQQKSTLIFYNFRSTSMQKSKNIAEFTIYNKVKIIFEFA